ncbi:hypothetical protein WR25_15160 [Diploscapter pachys]|uniref:Serpentine receptor class gamma n=1 Tax=Diploscapter pachys TaxID=2018661 RepID=A0A2A2KPA7_9BILA|nr:hypothetical protein WR25_15160 [Diploscapter pachys]
MSAWAHGNESYDDYPASKFLVCAYGIHLSYGVPSLIRYFTIIYNILHSSYSQVPFYRLFLIDGYIFWRDHLNKFIVCVFFAPCLFTWHILFSQAYFTPLDGGGFAMAYTRNITWMRNSENMMIVSTFAMTSCTLFTTATLFRLRFIASISVRQAERRLLLITAIMSISLIGQFLIAVAFYFDGTLWNIPEKLYVLLFLLRPFAIDLAILSPSWTMHFLNRSIANGKSEFRSSLHSNVIQVG